MKKVISVLFLLAAGWFLTLQTAYTAEERVKNNKGSHLSKPAQGSVNRTLVNVGQVSMWIYSNGQSAIGPDDNSGLYFPRGSLISAAIFQDGFIWGGKVNDGATPVVRVGGQTYSIGTAPGAIISRGVRENEGDRETVDRIWRVRRDYPTADLRQDAAELSLIQSAAVTDGQIGEVRAQYAEDWKDWPWQKGAPWTGINDVQDGGYFGAAVPRPGKPDSFVVMGAGNRILDRGEDTNSNGILDAGEDKNGNNALDGEFPGIAGADQVVWLVANDLNPNAVRTAYGSPSIGFEMQVTLWAYRRADALGNIIFKQFRIIWKGTATTTASATIDSLYFCQWSDPDLGSAGDDLAGCDVSKSLGYVYNAVSIDGNYAQVGLAPPASGYDFFAGPLVQDDTAKAIFGLKRRPGFRNLPMTTFAFFAAGQVDSDPTRGGDYNGTLQWWNLLRGYRPRPENPPQPWIDPTNNQVTLFRVSGDPVTGEGWIDENPGDRRILLAAGPFTMDLNPATKAVLDTQEVVVAVMAGLGSDRLSSISILRFIDRFAQAAFDNLFDLPKPPDTPVLSPTEFDSEILLNWGENLAAIAATEAKVNKGYAFEGYNVYQLPNAGASKDLGILLATYDLPNEITTITQETFDPRSGQILNLPVQLGKNTGIRRTFSIDRDRFREKPLANGQIYYFGVSAYSYNAKELIKTLESPMAVATVVPQMTDPGIRFQTVAGDTLKVAHKGPSDGAVYPIVVDPGKTKKASYKITFDADGLWTLADTTKGTVLLSAQQNQNGDNTYFITDGLQVKVVSPPLAGLSSSSSGPRWVAGGNHGGDTFGGGAFLGLNFVGSSVKAANYHNIRVEFFAKESFTDLNGNGKYSIGEPYKLKDGDGHQKAFMYQTWGGAYLGFLDVPFKVTDTERNIQLNVLVRDRDANMQWDLHKQYEPVDPDFVNVNNGDLRFNYIFIMDTQYDPTGKFYDPNQGGINAFADILLGVQPVQWALWLDFRGGNREPYGAAFTMDFIAPNVNTAADVFTFSSQTQTYSDADARADLSLVNVFPNPYLGFNRAELNRIQRFVTFSHLPRKATIRIFNLAGILVKTIEKDDEKQFITWDLANERNLPAASGVYIAHIEFPDLSQTKILKLAVVREEQFLRNY